MSALASVAGALAAVGLPAQGIPDRAPTVGHSAYLIIAAVLFAIGATGVLIRRNLLVMFMCVELMLNAVNLSFVAFASRMGDVNGQVAVFFTLVVAAAEVVVGLGIIVAISRRRRGTTTADDLHLLQG